MKNNKAYNFNASNRIHIDNLENVEKCVFENVYREADRTLYKIVKDKTQNTDRKMFDDNRLNVLSFLGERGRGKTSAMSSFFEYMNSLTEYEWSSFYGKKIDFVILPYIDAAMLAENEYIFDAILAEMWDWFEKKFERRNRGYETDDIAYHVQNMKKAFINVRKAYLVMKERETAQDGRGVDYDKDMPIPGALHELAASLNLRDKMKELVKQFLNFSDPNRERESDIYLVIPIDDIDMSGEKAYLILEQLRRFLRIPQVIILATADIERLQLACESRYRKIYQNMRDCRCFINEYLEKVLPYNMRMYMPEVGEQKDEIPIEKSIGEKLKLKNTDEKGMILEFIACHCNIWFDGGRKKRHFLQNYSLRSMINYFEQLERIRELDYDEWLKVDLKERLVERIQKTEHREFINKIFLRDYEDINTSLASFINATLKGDKKLTVSDRSLGQILYGCYLLEIEDVENVDFVNCILMFYSIILKQLEVDSDPGLIDMVVGNSMFGEWEYAAMANGNNQRAMEFCSGFANKGNLKIEISGEINSITIDEVLNSETNKNAIAAWVYALLFFNMIPFRDDRIFQLKNPENQESKGKEAEDKAKAQNNNKDENSDKIELNIQPLADARKNYFTSPFYFSEKIHLNLCKSIKEVYLEIAKWICSRDGKTEFEKEDWEDKAEKYKTDLLKELNITDEDGKVNYCKIPYQNVELFYHIGRDLAKIGGTIVNQQSDIFEVMALKYRQIRETFEKFDSYYGERFDSSVQTHYVEEFENSIQAKLMLGKIKMTDSVRKAFITKLGGMLIEPVGTLTMVKNPE